MEDKNLQYHITEYGYLRQELHQTFKDAYNTVIYAIIANAAIVAWVAANLGHVSIITNLLVLAACLALFISVTAWLMYIVRRRTIRRMSDYCMLVENHFALKELGWEHFYWRTIRSEKINYIGTTAILNAICMMHIALSLYFLYFVIGSL